MDAPLGSGQSAGWVTEGTDVLGALKFNSKVHRELREGRGRGRLMGRGGAGRR